MITLVIKNKQKTEFEIVEMNVLEANALMMDVFVF